MQPVHTSDYSCTCTWMCVYDFAFLPQLVLHAQPERWDVKKLASNDDVEVLSIFDACLANRAEFLVIRLQRLKSAWWTVITLLKEHFHVIMGDHTVETEVSYCNQCQEQKKVILKTDVHVHLMHSIIFQKVQSPYQRCMASFPTQTAKFSSKYVMAMTTSGVWSHYV